MPLLLPAITIFYILLHLYTKNFYVHYIEKQPEENLAVFD